MKRNRERGREGYTRKTEKERSSISTSTSISRERERWRETARGRGMDVRACTENGYLLRQKKKCVPV